MYTRLKHTECTGEYYTTVFTEEKKLYMKLKKQQQQQQNATTIPTWSIYSRRTTPLLLMRVMVAMAI